MYSCGARVLLQDASTEALAQFESLDAWLSEQATAGCSELDPIVSMAAVRTQLCQTRELIAAGCQERCGKLAQIGCCGFPSFGAEESGVTAGPSEQTVPVLPAQPAVVLAEYEKLLRFPRDIDVGLGIGAGVTAAELELRREARETCAQASLRDEACAAT